MRTAYQPLTCLTSYRVWVTAGVYKTLEHLWDAMEATEEEAGRRYTHTLVVRDDADWLAPMDLNRLLGSRPNAHGFALSCDARVPPLQPSEINDHAMLLTREHAHFLGRFYSKVILGGRATACRVHVSRSGRVHSPCWQRDGVARRHGLKCVGSCNSEELMRYALNRAGLRIHLVGQALLPFERSSHILVPPRGSGRTDICYHKMCQSHAQPLPTPLGRGLCSTLNLWRAEEAAEEAAKKALRQAFEAEVTREVARLAETLPAGELLSVTTIAEARVASRNCSRVAYTSVDVVGPHPLIVPPPGMDASCAFAFVGPDVTRLPPGKRRFVYLSNIRSPATRSVSLRLFSKLPKLSPHILFPRKWTVFFDSKLRMRASMDELWEVYVSRVLQPWRVHNSGERFITPFTAILHPYSWMRKVVQDATSNHVPADRLGGKEFLAWANQSTFEFMQTEARLLLTPQPKPCALYNRTWTRQPKPACDNGFKPLRVANASILLHQIERYVALSTTVTGPHADSYRYYIDTALLMQRDAGVLFGPWRAEMARTDSCDRDQISFAHTTARLRLKMRLLSGCHAPEPQWPAAAPGKQVCHWYIANESTVARVRRTELDGHTAADSVATSAGDQTRATTPRQTDIHLKVQPKPRTRAAASAAGQAGAKVAILEKVGALARARAMQLAKARVEAVKMAAGGAARRSGGR